MKLVQALLISGLSALSISAFAEEAPQTEQPVIVTTQAADAATPVSDEVNTAAAEAQTEQPATQNAATDETQEKVTQE